MLVVVVVAWIAYEAWAAVHYARTPVPKRSDFAGTWILVSGAFIAALWLALRVPADAFERFRRARPGRRR